MGAVYYNIMLDAEDLQFIEECINKHDMTPADCERLHAITRCITVRHTYAYRCQTN